MNSSDTQRTSTDTPLEGPVADLASLMGGGAIHGRSTVVVTGRDPIGPSPHRISEAAAATIATFGREVAALDETRGAPAQTVTVRCSDAFDQLRAPFLTDLNGVGPFLLTDDTGLAGLNGFYPVRDGWVFMTCTYPHLRNAVCAVLDCPPTPSAVAAAALGWNAVTLEDAVVAAGGVAAAARTAEQWARHPVGRHLAVRPVVEIDRIDDAPARPVPPMSATARNTWSPLAGLRVLDNTHVIAGPAAARLLAGFGADVLHTSTAAHPDPLGMIALTGGGKRSAYADLNDPIQRATFDELAAVTDVVVSSYRGLARRGLAAGDIAGRHPGVVVAELHCWGVDGPWGDRGGFDELASGATGLALEEGSARGVTRPEVPPTHLLNDYLTAYLAAAGVVAAIRRRAREGGSWRVRVNLARVATWVRDLGSIPADDVAHLDPPRPTIPRNRVSGPLGTLTEPVIPITFSHRSTPTLAAPTLPGTSALAFT